MNDRVIFTYLALRHAGTLYSAALHSTRNPHAAEDLVQDTYFRVIARFGRTDQATTVVGSHTAFGDHR